MDRRNRHMQLDRLWTVGTVMGRWTVIDDRERKRTERNEMKRRLNIATGQ